MDLKAKEIELDELLRLFDSEPTLHSGLSEQDLKGCIEQIQEITKGKGFKQSYEAITKAEGEVAEKYNKIMETVKSNSAPESAEVKVDSSADVEPEKVEKKGSFFEDAKRYPIMRKLVVLKQMVVKIQQRIESEVMASNPDLKGKFSWEKPAMFLNTPNRVGCVIDSDKVYTNINVKELLSLTSTNAYASVYGSVRKGLEKKGYLKEVSALESSENEVEKTDDAEAKKDKKEQGVVAKRRAIVSALKESFRDVIMFYVMQNSPDNKKAVGALAELAAVALVDGIPESKLDEFATNINGNVTLSQEQKDVYGKKAVNYLSDSFEVIFKKLSDEANLALANGDIETYRQRNQTLGGLSMMMAGKNAMESSQEAQDLIASTQGQGRGQFTEAQIAPFVDSFVKEFTAANNLKPIKILYVDTDAKGEYVDGGAGNQCIQINPKKIASVADLVSTISHELTHAVDSSFNKLRGKTNKKVGGGLLDNAANVQSFNHASYAEMKKIAYRLSLDERHGRVGELAGMNFMLSTMKKSNMTKEAKETVYKTMLQNANSFINFQNETIAYCNQLPAKIQEYKSLLNSGELSRADAKKLEGNIAQLQEWGSVGVEKELESINLATEIINSVMMELNLTTKEKEDMLASGQVDKNSALGKMLQEQILEEQAKMNGSKKENDVVLE